MTSSRIAVVSDSHDRSSYLQKALSQINGAADTLVHCGDLCSPSMMNDLARFDGEVHVVPGNSDKEVLDMKKVADKIPNLSFYPYTADIKVNRNRVAAAHFPRSAQKLAQSGKYDVVFFGHTHEFNLLQFGEIPMVNCGDIYGRKHPPSYVIYDLQTGAAEHCLIDL
jgi:uncharacterized protein